jgi:hypothetical protein
MVRRREPKLHHRDQAVPAGPARLLAKIGEERRVRSAGSDSAKVVDLMLV